MFWFIKFINNKHTSRKAPPFYGSNWYFKGHFIFGPALSKGMIFVAREKNNKGRQQPMPTYTRSLTAFVQRNTSSEWHYFGRKRRPDMFYILVSKAYNIINSLELLRVSLGNWETVVLNIKYESTKTYIVFCLYRGWYLYLTTKSYVCNTVWTFYRHSF